MGDTPWRGDLCRCQDCLWKGDQADTDPIDDLHERVSLGEPMPSGQCPECGALCQPEREHLRIEYDRSYSGGDYSDVGEFVLIPFEEIGPGRVGVEKAFEKRTGLHRRNIVHYCRDERYDADGDPIQ